MKRFFDSELEDYRSHIGRMLTLTHRQMRNAVNGLLDHDVERASTVSVIEKEVDHLDIEVDSEAIRYLNLRAPIASELRLIMAGSRMSHEFERIGDESNKIAKRAIRIEAKIPDSFLDLFSKMYDIVETMFDDLQFMFTEADPDRAYDLIARDAGVDKLDRKIKNAIVKAIESEEIQPKIGIELISCSRSLERIGDHIQNAAEIIVFLVTGEDIREDSF